VLELVGFEKVHGDEGLDEAGELEAELVVDAVFSKSASRQDSEQ